jgi:hypothetical protein
MSGARITLALSVATVVGFAWPLEPAREAEARGAHSGDDAVTANRRCAGCHEGAAREHAGGEHATAFTDPAFQRAFAREPLPYCRSCHAPEDRGVAAQTSGAASSLGVACTSCHAPVGGAQTIAPAPSHPPIRARDDVRSGCASCHQFPFPPGPSQPPGLMQRTVDEHRGSPFASVPCVDCHVPAVQRGPRAGRSHVFAGGHDAALVRSAVRVRTERAPGGRVLVTLEAGAVGHSFPTGDLFRRLVVSAEAVGPDESVIADATVHLARHFERRVDDAGHVEKVEVRDDRLRSGERRTISLELGAEADAWPVRHAVIYERLDVPAETVVTRRGRTIEGPPATVEGAIRIAEGELAPNVPIAARRSGTGRGER